MTSIADINEKELSNYYAEVLTKLGKEGLGGSEHMLRGAFERIDMGDVASNPQNYAVVLEEMQAICNQEYPTDGIGHDNLLVRDVMELVGQIVDITNRYAVVNMRL